MNSVFFSGPGSVICEPGAISQLPGTCLKLGIESPLIVTDQGIVDAGLMGAIDACLSRAGIRYSCFSEVESDPGERTVLSALDNARKSRADGIIGFGGGSSMDIAKVVALLVSSNQKLDEVYGTENARGKRQPLIQIPTTAGTGSEATNVAVITTGASTKAGIVTSQLYADVAILDAELTIGLPAPITAATGIDAMVHAIESYTSVHLKNGYSDMLAVKALELLSQSIRTAVFEPGDLKARHEMLLGAYLAGQAFSNAPVAAVHALAYPLGARFHIPHGVCNALMLPHVLRYNATVVEDQYLELSKVVLIGSDQEATGSEKVKQFVDYFVALIDDLSIPKSLRLLNIAESDLEMLAEDAMLQQRLLINNPRNVELRDALGIYRAAYGTTS